MIVSEIQAQAEALLGAQVTPGTWYYSGGEVRALDEGGDGSVLVASINAIPRGDGELCAAAPTLARQVVDFAGREQLLRDLLTRVLPVNTPGGTLCRICRERLTPARGHGPDCPVPSILDALAQAEG